MPEDVGRTALVFEGFKVAHVHAKLFPLHGTKMKKWKRIEGNVRATTSLAFQLSNFRMLKQ